MKKLVALLFISSFFQCSTDRNISPLSNDELKRLETFERLYSENQVKITDDNEPGQKLYLCLRLVSKDSNTPLKNRNIRVYHTSAAGEYEPANPSDESTARLNGKVKSNDEGLLFVTTILPGDYGSSEDNRHIHTTIKDAKPDAYDIHFKQYISMMGKNFVLGSDQHFLADLKMKRDSTLVAFVTIEVKTAQ